MEFVNINRLKSDLAPVMSVAGVYFCYRRNGGPGGVRFAERYLAVGWVISWRLGLVMMLGVAFALVAALLTTGNLNWLGDSRIVDGVNVGMLALVTVIYWRLGVHLADVRGATAPQGSA
jgi:hypothetical protein